MRKARSFVLGVKRPRAAVRAALSFGLLALVPGVVLGAAAPAAAYTVKRTSTGEPIRWSVDAVSVEVHGSLARTIGNRPARDAVGLSVDAWRGLGGPDLVLARTASNRAYQPGLAGTQVVRPDAWPYDPRLLAVTATTYDDYTGRVLDADVLINPEVDFALLAEGEAEDDDVYDLGAVLTHEMGHVLGLGETDADPLATMWPRIGRGDTHQRSVELDDEEGVSAVYASIELAPAVGCGGNTVARGPGPGALTWLVALGVAALLGWLAWRKRNEDGLRLRGGARAARSPAAGVVFAGAVVLLALPTWAGRADDDAPAGVRSARAFAAHRRPPRERAAMLEDALRDDVASVRRAALLGILAGPRRGDAARVAPLLDDPEPRVAHLAREAWERSVRAAPEEVVAPDARFAPFADGVRAVTARGVRCEQSDDGMIITRVDADGETLTLPGGCLDGICQRYGEALLPGEGDALYVAEGAAGAWAYRAGDVAYGGWLGDGPGVRVP